jgi:hypothetical protein
MCVSLGLSVLTYGCKVIGLWALIALSINTNAVQPLYNMTGIVLTSNVYVQLSIVYVYNSQVRC